MLAVYTCIAGEHDLRLVAIAGFICLIAAFTATSLFDQASISGRRRAGWIALTAFVSGTGIWATHFIAMLSFESHLETGYDLKLTLLSIALAILITGLGWWIALGRSQAMAAAGGAIIGLGIGVMHYVGMAALMVRGQILWNHGGVAMSLLVGAILGAAALASHKYDNRHIPWRAALLLTLAICGLHFTGMTAASLLPDPTIEIPPQTMSAGVLTAAVTAMALVILAISFGIVILDRRLGRNAVEEAQHLRTLADAAVEGLIVIDGERVVDANLGFLKLAGYLSQNIPPCTLGSLFPDLDPADLTMSVDAAPVETRLINPRGRNRQVELLMRPISWKGIDLCAIAVRDVTERNEATARIAHLAYHDPLTGLPNRTVYGEHLSQAIEAAPALGQSIAVLTIDLDGFKAVNDLYGHPVGDELLVAVAKRLRRVTREGDLVARLGGDEFAIIQYGNGDSDHAAMLAARILRVLDRPLRVGPGSIMISCSIGVAMFPADADSGVDLMKNADIALYRAKADGRSMVRFYEAAMDEAIRYRHRLGMDLRRAIELNEISLDYQPVADIRTGEIVGFEALARWKHGKLGAISPATFVPIAEETGYIGRLGSWILRRAISDAAQWELPLTLSVNVSPGQFVHGDLSAEIQALLAETGFDAKQLDVEVTEDLLIRNRERAVATLQRLASLGVQITIDDFGTGYSSLSYFRMFPFDKVKIDQCFTHDLVESAEARAIVSAVIGLGHGLGMLVVAEGVETRGQLDTLRSLGCDLVQGYLISKPKPMRHLDRMVLRAPLEEEPLVQHAA